MDNSPKSLEGQSSPTRITALPADVFREIAGFLTDKEIGDLQTNEYVKDQMTELKSTDNYWKSRSSKLLRFEFRPEDSLLPGLTWEFFYKQLPDKPFYMFDEKAVLTGKTWEKLAQFFPVNLFIRWLEAYPKLSFTDQDNLILAMLKFDRDDLYEPLLRSLNLEEDEEVPFKQELLHNALSSNQVWKIITKLIPEIIQLNDEDSDDDTYSALGFLIESLASSNINHFILVLSIYSELLEPYDTLRHILSNGAPIHLPFLFKKYSVTRGILYETVVNVEPTINSNTASFIVSIYTDQEFSNLVDFYSGQQNLSTSAMYTAATRDPRWRRFARN